MRLIDADALIDNAENFYCIECIRRKGIKNGKVKFVYEIGDAPCRACDVSDMIDSLEEAPTVPTVPLDKLCEFLVKCGADSYCGTCKQIMGECFTNGHGCGSEHFWKELLTKWMEGLDAAD